MSKILEGLAVVAEVTGTTLSKQALQVMERELSQYDTDKVLLALQRCMRELKHRMTLADVLERLQGSDGRPNADEAWSIALAGMDEDATVMLNQDISEAMSVARPIYDDGDSTGARMAFRAAYERIVDEARLRGDLVKWWASVGHDPTRRETGLRAAVDRGLLTHEQVMALLPAPVERGGDEIVKLLAGPKADVRQKLLALRSELSRKG